VESLLDVSKLLIISFVEYQVEDSLHSALGAGLHPLFCKVSSREVCRGVYLKTAPVLT
jgi:hypothetical protein